ncbi:MAG TPA: chromate resistance protein ChrB domain-containing protein [Candidatus Wunengus sp. YC60]|uniref:chromate resistance protein ChrB domain-containing protein n=1 Tax=Candidatus Wunengus sp. YC60 TaxID=3367697 RepID=UPI004026E1A9
MNKWILLIHQIAQDSPNLRVKIWRNLKKHGAVLFKNAVYMLPLTNEHEETMQWLCSQIKEGGSDASLFITESLDKEQDEEIIKTFQDVCNKEYLDLIDSCNNLLKKIEQAENTEGITDKSSNTLNRELNEITKGVGDIAKIDFFHASQNENVFNKIHLMQQKLNRWSRTTEKGITTTNKVYKAKDFLNKKWVTRKDIFIDRLASAWLIKRFIDPKARFVFSSKDKKPGDAIPFDMYGSEFTHHGEDCTFETLIKVFDLNDPALQSIAEIVHDIDLKDSKYGRKEAEGVTQIVTGLSQKLRDDNKLLEKGLEIFDALYQCYSSNTEGGN